MKTALSAVALVLMSLSTCGAAQSSAAPSAPPPARRLIPAFPPAAAKTPYELVPLRDGSTLLAAPGGSYALVRDAASLIMLYLRAGKLWTNVVARKDRPFEVRTAFCVAAPVEGARFSVEAKPEGSFVVVERGVVSVQELRLGVPVGEAALVRAGYRAEASSDGLSVLPLPLQVALTR